MLLGKFSYGGTKVVISFTCSQLFFYLFLQSFYSTFTIFTISIDYLIWLIYFYWDSTKFIPVRFFQLNIIIGAFILFTTTYTLMLYCTLIVINISYIKMTDMLSSLYTYIHIYIYIFQLNSYSLLFGYIFFLLLLH